MLTARARAGQPDPIALPLHPLLAAAYPVLFLFARNAADQVTLGPLWLPLAASVGGALTALVVATLATGDVRRGALLATLAVALFFTFGHAWFLLHEAIGLRRYLIGGYLLVGLAGGWLVWRGGGWVVAATRFLNVVLAALVAINAISIASFGFRAATAATSPASPVPLQIEGARTPDIYYVVLDRYANSETLREVYGHDNSRFLDALRARGFHVADEAWANYLKTALSLASSLQMDFLDGGALAADARPGQELDPINAMLRTELAGPMTLKAIGYEYVHIGTFWEPTATNAAADVTFNRGDGLEFLTAFGETTALSLLSPARTERSGRTIYAPDLVREFHEYGFAQLEAARHRDGPTFTFAHFLLPHPPYVYEADGSLPPPGSARRPEEERYVAQLEHTNARLLEVVDQLLDVPAGEEPVIILQADEGPYPPEFDQNERHFQWLQASPEQIQQKFGILNAMYLPDEDPEAAGLHARSSPVNALRYVLNAYFDAGLPLRPETVYLSPDYVRLYDFAPYERPDR